MFVTPEFTVEHQGSTIYGQVSPCSFMYPRYGLQVRLSMVKNPCNAESEFIRDQSITVQGVDGAVVTAAAVKLTVEFLQINGKAPLLAALGRWVAAKAGFDAAEEVRRQRSVAALERRIAKRKAGGYTHRIVAWIHPLRGDDHMVEGFTRGEPTSADLAWILMKSTVKTDFTVTAL